MRSRYASRAGALTSVVLIVWLGNCGAGTAQQNYDNPKTSEGWAWAQIKKGTEADFNQRCGTSPLDPRTDDDHWGDKCRQLSVTFITDVLTREPWRSKIPSAGVQISGARLQGTLNLKNAKVGHVLTIERSRIEDDIDLVRAQTDSLISFRESRVAGEMRADGLRSQSSLWLASTQFSQAVFMTSAKIEKIVDMDGATVEGTLDADNLHAGDVFMRSTADSKASFKYVNFRGANITGQIDMNGATVEGTLYADSLRVAGHLLMRSTVDSKATFNDVNFKGANINGQIDMSGATVEGTLDADTLHVAAHLFMRSNEVSQASFKDVNLSGAKIDGLIDMDGATVDGAMNADSLRVGDLFLTRSTEQNKATFKDMDLTRARIGLTLNMDGAIVDGVLNADTLHVEADLFMRKTENNQPSFKKISLIAARIGKYLDLSGANVGGPITADTLEVGQELIMRGASFAEPIYMVFAHIGGNVDLRGATLAHLDLSGASIGRNLTLGDAVKSPAPTIWRTRNGSSGTLWLQNARVTNLMDAKDAWPGSGFLHLEGFSFGHLGGNLGNTGAEMRARGAAWWDGWIRRDGVYHPASYDQLAAAFTAAGDRDAANEIRYRSRVRQREQEKEWSPWLSSLVFQYTAGFGIGDYTFRVLYWVIGISALGALYLRLRIPAGRQHGLIWCYGASLSRLLPIIEVNREFTDFFNDPGRERLTGFQSFVFSVIGMVGWLLGAILIAAVSGLVPKG